MEKCLFLSPEWVQQVRAAINADEKYHKAARNISDCISFKILGKHPAGGDRNETYFYLGIKEGRCIEAVPESRKADFYLTGKYEDWKAVLDGHIDVIKAIVKGKIKMKGNMLHMLKNAIPTTMLVACFQAVPTRYE
jgi:putative sterol carrier protein